MQYQPCFVNEQTDSQREVPCPEFHSVLVSAGVGIQFLVFPPSLLSEMRYLQRKN